LIWPATSIYRAEGVINFTRKGKVGLAERISISYGTREGACIQISLTAIKVFD
jgi:hypothetical protein